MSGYPLNFLGNDFSLEINPDSLNNFPAPPSLSFLTDGLAQTLKTVFWSLATPLPVEDSPKAHSIPSDVRPIPPTSTNNIEYEEIVPPPRCHLPNAPKAPPFKCLWIKVGGLLSEGESHQENDDEPGLPGIL